MTQIKNFIVMLSFMISAQALAVPCDQMQLQVNNTNADTTFSSAVNMTLTVKANTNDGGCNFFIDFSSGGGGSYNTRRMLQGSDPWPYDVLKTLSPVQSLKSLAEATSSNDVLTGVMPGYAGNDTQVTLNFWVQRDSSNPWRRAGNYTDNFSINLYKGNLSSYSFVANRSMSTNNNAQKQVDISVLPPGGSFDLAIVTQTLDFGQLSTNQTRSADIRIKTNSGYKLRASSLNGGRLKHVTDNKHINYSASFSGASYGLSSPKEVASANNTVVSPASGILVPVTVTIGSVTGAQNGDYEDTITLSVVAQ